MYDVLYADFPWPYQRTVGQGVASKQYNLMTMAELSQLPIMSLANEHCMLFYWVTGPLLPEQIVIPINLGFRYVTIAVNCIKVNPKSTSMPFFGIGSHTKSNSELCLLYAKGKSVLPATNSISQIQITEEDETLIVAPRSQHSRKPNIVRQKIVELYPDA